MFLFNFNCYYSYMNNELVKTIEYTKLKPNEDKEFHKFFEETINKLFYHDYTKNTLKFFCEADVEFPPNKIKEYSELGNIFVAKDGDHYAGFLIFDNPEGGSTSCRWLAVDNNYQKNGIASKLIGLYESEAKKRGAHCIILVTEKRNQRFYKKRGFRYMGLNPAGYYGAPDYWFYKQIQKPKEKNYLKEVNNSLILRFVTRFRQIFR